MAGCPLEDGSGNVAESDGGRATDGGVGGPAAPPGSWQTVAGPCLGSQTNALHFDDPKNGFVGCGENADGHGLHATTDGGRSWAKVDGFEQVRVSDIRRGPGGALLLAGKDTAGAAIAYSFDDTTGEATVLVEYGPRAPFMRIGHAENVVVAPDGAALVDSLTGGYVGYRAAGQAGFVEHYNLDDAAEAPLTIRRLGWVDGAFFGVGGSIADPPQVFLESPAGRPLFTRVDLGAGNDGELYAFGAHARGVFVGGWDQTDREPLLFLGVGELTKPESWTRVDLTPWVAAGAIRGLHVLGDAVLIVGDKFPTAAGGFALFSPDGEAWEDVTPPNASVISRGALFSSGAAVLAGASGFFAIGAP